MAFAITEKKITVFGDKRIETGVYTSTASGTGGNITHGMQTVENVFLQPKGSAVVAGAPAVNETLPLTGNTPITIVTEADEVGTYMLIGK